MTNREGLPPVRRKAPAWRSRDEADCAQAAGSGRQLSAGLITKFPAPGDRIVLPRSVSSGASARQQRSRYSRTYASTDRVSDGDEQRGWRPPAPSRHDGGG